MLTSNILKDHGSHRYMAARLDRIDNERWRTKATHAMQRAESFFARYPTVDYAFLLPTDTGLRKGIMDATAPVRGFLADNDLHDYTGQQQGERGKAMLDGCLLTSIESIGSVISVYRPMTKKGDPRIWFFQLAQHIEPFDLLALITDGYTVYAINAATDFESNPEIIRTVERCAHHEEYSPITEHLLEKLEEISAMGFIPSVKRGDTGVGMTLEDALGIPPNSDRGPDWNGIELKAHRIDKVTGHQTLFAEKPCWDHSEFSASGLLDRFGYLDAKGRTALYTTMYGSHRNPQHFRLINKTDDDLMCADYTNTDTGETHPEAAVWHMEDVRSHFRTKHRETFWIGAETRKVGKREEFHFVDVSITKTPDYMRMEELITKGWVTIDFTLTYKPAKGNPLKFRPRDHGYLWRATPQGMETLFRSNNHYQRFAVK